MEQLKRLLRVLGCAAVLVIILLVLAAGAAFGNLLGGIAPGNLIPYTDPGGNGGASSNTQTFDPAKTAEGPCKELREKFLYKSTFTGTKSDALRIDVFNKEAGTSGFSAAELASLAATESDFYADAQSGVGAKGVMQLMPATWAEVGGGSSDIFNPEPNVHFGAKYFQKIRGLLSRKDTAFLAAAYNAGPYHKDIQLGKVPEGTGYAETRRQYRVYQQNFNKFADCLGSTAAGDGPVDGNCSEKVIAFARKAIGATYSQASRLGPNSYDCSGLTFVAFKAFGYRIPDLADFQGDVTKYNGVKATVVDGTITTTAMSGAFHDPGQQTLHIDKLQPGDLVFFRTINEDNPKTVGLNGISHVGIYSGNGKMIHAGVTSGVIEESIDTTYWRPKYRGAVRVCNAVGGKPPSELNIDTSKMMSGTTLEKYKGLIKDYNRRHSGINSWELQPRWIVMHTTETTGFPTYFTQDPAKVDLGDTPGRRSQYVIEGSKVYQLMPEGIVSRSAYGLNHSSYNFEIVGSHNQDLPEESIEQAALLAVYLADTYNIPTSHIISHRDISEASFKRGSAAVITDYKDAEDYTGNARVDPGSRNMQAIKARVAELQGGS